MAIGTPTERYAVARTTQTGTTTLSPATTIAAGTLAVLLTANATSKTITSISDNVGGNTWGVDLNWQPSANVVGASSCQIVNAIGTSAVITITWSASTSASHQIWIEEVTGLATSSALDKTATISATGTAAATNATATLSQANEICFGVFRNAGGGTWAHGATYTDLTTPTLASLAAAEYKIVAATTAVQADGTWSPSVAYVGGVITYKMAAASATVNQPGFRFGFT